MVLNTVSQYNLEQRIQQEVAEVVQSLYGFEIPAEKVNVAGTRREFEGDYTVTVFPFTAAARKKPEEIGEEIGNALVDRLDWVDRYNVIKGFLNLVLSDRLWMEFLQSAAATPTFGKAPSNGKKVMVEFSSPNTNKPLHLGHIRNILLGWSCSKILDFAGYEVVRVQIVNDRGIAICKSMLAWQRFGEGKTPESSGIKGDHFVGDFYVEFEKRFQEEYRNWQDTPSADAVFAAKGKPDQDKAEFFKAFKNDYFNEYSDLGSGAKKMLQQWESGDPEVIALWRQMNNWVYKGFDQTYESLGVQFDQLYFESDTYLLGKDLIDKGLSENIFYRKPDGSVWIDLEDAKLDHKLVLRSDGTSVYITQDIGTAHRRYQDFGAEKMVYVVADEQNYHFQVLFEVMKRLGEPYSDGLFHLSYGMVDLPTGKMKSREGTVVDADDLVGEVIAEAKQEAASRGEIAGLTEAEQADIVRKVGLAALKFFIIKVQPKKRMTFDPKESVDMQGQTGPYIQYAYVRINGLMRLAGAEGHAGKAAAYAHLEPIEREMIQTLYQFPSVVQQAAQEYDPSQVANYCYNLAKLFNKFWHDVPILKSGTAEEARAFRLEISRVVGQVLKNGLDLLGIEVPAKM